MKATAQKLADKQSAKQLSELVGKTLHPVARKRGFASVDLLGAWPELVGGKFAGRVQPGKMVWPRTRNADGEPVADPATLYVHADGPTALFFMHEVPQVKDRINAFFGWKAVNAIKVLQRPAPSTTKKEAPKPRELSDAEKKAIKERVSGISNERLQRALEKLGCEIASHSAS